MRDSAAIRRHVAQTMACREAQLAELNGIRARIRRPLREIILNGDREPEGALHVDDAPDGVQVLDVEMLDNAAEDIFRGQRHS